MWCRRFLLASLVAALSVSLAAFGAPLPPRPRSPDGPLGMMFVRLPKGTFYMGWDGEVKGKKTEIKADFEIAIHTVTQGQWQAVMGTNPSYFSRNGEGKDEVKEISDADLKQFPVENVSWNDAQDFVKKLNEKERGTGWTYRLPTEAEWEYACRGGATSEEEYSHRFYFDKPSNVLSAKEANFCDDPFGNADKIKPMNRPTVVGSYRPNKLGLFDMHGNVGQWCQDLKGVSDRVRRVFRGGGWALSGLYCQAAQRLGGLPADRVGYLGFRLARVPSAGK